MSQRVSSQQSQVQASQNIEATTITSVPPQNNGISRTVTLVQTERVEIQEEKINQLCLDEQRIEAEIAKKKELKRQAEEKERKQREREEFERKEKEKERREQRLRQLEEEKIESEKKARLERERLLKSEQEKARKVTSEPLPSESPLNSRVKRSAGELLQSENNTIPQESNPIKKRRPEVNHSSTSNLLFEDQPLVKIEPSFHSQSNKCTIDTEGWTTIDKTNTGSNCIEMTPSLVHTSGTSTSTAPIQISSRRSVINFDDPNSSQFKINDTTHHVECPQAVVVEMKFQMKSNQIHQNNHEGHQHPKDQRKFKKNLVRTLQINDRNPSLSSSSSLLPSPSMKLKKSDMDKVLPKESERELLVKFSSFLLF